MKFLLGLLIGLWVGGPAGFIIAGIMTVSAMEDEQLEKSQNNQREGADK